jgi:hypothetical protein
VHAKARKRTKKTPVIQIEQEAKRVRLDLSPANYQQLERAAKIQGSEQGVLRPHGVLAMIKVDDAKGGAT